MNLQQMRDQETRAWRELTPSGYDHAICVMAEEIRQTDVLIALADLALRRHDPVLTDSRACCAERLLALLSPRPHATVQVRISLLFLLAWLHLATVVHNGPESMPVTADLPAGVALPRGVDPTEITDPELRAQAEEMVRQHRDLAERWNAKQQALGHLRRLAAALRDARPHFTDQALPEELATAMSLAPGLPADLFDNDSA